MTPAARAVVRAGNEGKELAQAVWDYVPRSLTEGFPLPRRRDWKLVALRATALALYLTAALLAILGLILRVTK